MPRASSACAEGTKTLTPPSAFDNIQFALIVQSSSMKASMPADSSFALTSAASHGVE
jgi:hypothetical protein